MQLFRKPKLTKKKIIILSVVIVLLTIFCIFQNKYLTVDEYTFTSAKVSKSADDFRIVQVSDLHNAKFGKNNSRLISKIKDQSPDIIVITGDIVDSNHTNIDTATDFCKEAAKIAPCYYITGNHEMWLDKSETDTLYSGMNSAGVTILDSTTITLENGIYLTGLGDDHLYDGTLAKLSESVPDDALHIVLAHEPQYLEEEYKLSSPDLIITGHAHGGQVRLPFIGGIIAPDQGFFPKYTAGEYKSGDTTMYVSRGLGNSVIPLRLFNTPEINLLKIKAN
ncbi:metallophosphoesterase [Ruminococcus albus SY3]|uniref:Metallophosphoesterase n=1 Tax=Ruminococcus albus SY3 TaxID=1341156 RepID=A0A011VWZ2_RUMAL|nr:metallophosphoesterase [Ruminococcus albus]EXM39113.1 metallophosphoesterase [Ruminococcus albus SY3]